MTISIAERVREDVGSELLTAFVNHQFDTSEGVDPKLISVTSEELEAKGIITVGMRATRSGEGFNKAVLP